MSSLTVLFFAMEAISVCSGYCCCVVRKLATCPTLTVLRSLQFYTGKRACSSGGWGEAHGNTNFRQFHMQLDKVEGNLFNCESTQSQYFSCLCLDFMLCRGLMYGV